MPKQTTSRIPHFTQVTLQTPSTFHSQIQKKSQIPYLTRTRAPKSQQAHAKGKEEKKIVGRFLIPDFNRCQ
jgi:hypothetical protein